MNQIYKNQATLFKFSLLNMMKIMKKISYLKNNKKINNKTNFSIIYKQKIKINKFPIILNNIN